MEQNRNDCTRQHLAVRVEHPMDWDDDPTAATLLLLSCYAQMQALSVIVYIQLLTSASTRHAIYP